MVPNDKAFTSCMRRVVPRGWPARRPDFRCRKHPHHKPFRIHVPSGMWATGGLPRALCAHEIKFEFIRRYPIEPESSVGKIELAFTSSLEPK